MTLIGPLGYDRFAVQVTILMAGMVFISNGFPVGTSGYSLLTGVVATLVIVSTTTFTAFVLFEVYRSVRYAKQHEEARKAEAERIERMYRGRHSGGGSSSGSGGGSSHVLEPGQVRGTAANAARLLGVSIGRRVSRVALAMRKRSSIGIASNVSLSNALKRPPSPENSSGFGLHTLRRLSSRIGRRDSRGSEQERSFKQRLTDVQAVHTGDGAVGGVERRVSHAALAAGVGSAAKPDRPVVTLFATPVHPSTAVAPGEATDSSDGRSGSQTSFVRSLLRRGSTSPTGTSKTSVGTADWHDVQARAGALPQALQLPASAVGSDSQGGRRASINVRVGQL